MFFFRVCVQVPYAIRLNVRYLVKIGQAELKVAIAKRIFLVAFALDIFCCRCEQLLRVRSAFACILAFAGMHPV